MDAVDLVIRGHHRPWFPAFDRKHEREQVYFPQRSLRNPNIDTIPLVLLVIADKMLETGDHTIGLDTLY